jgi:hypothetical protein
VNPAAKVCHAMNLHRDTDHHILNFNIILKSVDSFKHQLLLYTFINTKRMQAITFQLGCVFCYFQSENRIRTEELHVIAVLTASNPL